MKTLYITDLDGTLLDSSGNLSFNCITKLNKLIADGALFTVATARTSATVIKMFEKVNLNIPFILMNGVLIYDPKTNENISAHTIDISTAEKIIEIYKKYNYSPMLYYMRENCVEIKYNKIHNIYQQEYVSARDNLKNKIFTEVNGDLTAGNDENLIYMVSLDKPELLTPIKEEISSLDDIYCAFYSDNYTDCNFMECMNVKASKGTATLKIKELLGVDHIIAFGDNLNDMPMFSVADETYAVENACDELKSVSDGIVDSNDNDGVINFIFEHFYNTL